MNLNFPTKEKFLGILEIKLRCEIYFEPTVSPSWGQLDEPKNMKVYWRNIALMSLALLTVINIPILIFIGIVYSY